MARGLLISEEPSPQGSSPALSEAIRIEIPANEFSNAANTASSPPPTRLLSRPGAKPSFENWEKRLHDATAARNASLEQMRHRCKDHIDHVVSVVNGVKETRRQDSAARHEHLRSMQLEAAERRRQLLIKREQDMVNARDRRARILRKRSAEQKMADVQSARNARNEAAQRRGRLLAEKKKMAARFSSPRKEAALPMRSLSPDRMTDDRSSSPSSMSTASGEDSDMTRDSSSNESSPQSAYGGLPRLLADNCPKMMNLESGDGMKEANPPAVMVVSDDAVRAAGKISGYYLLSKARRAMSKAGVLGPQLSSYSFEDSTALLESSGAQNAVDLIFQALGMRNKDRRMIRRDIVRERTERRILLSCLIVSLHPEAVMEEKVRKVESTEEETTSVDSLAIYAARQVLLCLHFGTLGAVAAAWVKWRRAFMKWKKNDAENLLRAMIEDAVATEALRTAVDRRFTEAEGMEGMRSALGAAKAAAALHQQEHAVWEEQLNLKQQKIRDAVVKLSGTTGERRLDAALVASHQIQDERIVHEIMMDLQGLLKRIQISSAVPDQVWERLRDELSTEPPKRDELASRLVHISKTLNAMIPGCFSLDSDEGLVDLDAEFATGLVCRVADALQKCQAEMFDDALREWVNEAVVKLRSAGQSLISVVIDVLRELTEFVEHVHHTVFTFRIQKSAPVVQQYGAAWERSHFQGHVASGAFSSSFPRTRDLLSETLTSIGAESSCLKQEVSMERPESVRTLLTRAIVHLIVKPQACGLADLPEFMHLDLERILEMQSDVQRCALVASLDNIGKQFLHSKGVSRSLDGLKEILDVCEDENTRLPQVQESFLSWMERSIRHRDEKLTDSERQLLNAMVERTIKPGDSTFSLMQKRVEKAICEYSLRMRTRIGGSSLDRGPNPSWDIDLPMGLESVETIMLELGKSVGALVQHLLHVHGPSLVSVMKSL